MKYRIIIAAIAATLFATSCTNENEARELLQSQGYTNIEMTGYKFFSCAEDENIHTGFSALTPNGTPIDGTVCSGIIFKGTTIRF